MTGKSKFSEEHIQSAIEYRRTHSTVQTADHYGVSTATIRYWLKQRGIRSQRVKQLAPDEQPEVRVLKKVPEGFKVPHRRSGW